MQLYHVRMKLKEQCGEIHKKKKKKFKNLKQSLYLKTNPNKLNIIIFT